VSASRPPRPQSEKPSLPTRPRRDSVSSPSPACWRRSRPRCRSEGRPRRSPHPRTLSESPGARSVTAQEGTVPARRSAAESGIPHSPCQLERAGTGTPRRAPRASAWAAPSRHLAHGAQPASIPSRRAGQPVPHRRNYAGIHTPTAPECMIGPEAATLGCAVIQGNSPFNCRNAPGRR